MHDGPEGVIPYTIANVLVGLIDVDKIITIEDLQDVKPGYERKIKFKQSASESLCLLQLLAI